MIPTMFFIMYVYVYVLHVYMLIYAYICVYDMNDSSDTREGRDESSILL